MSGNGNGNDNGNIKPCLGRVRSSDRTRRWYVPPGHKTSTCTYCEECFVRNVKGTPDELKYTMYTGLEDCNCDYPRDYSKHGIEKSGVRVIVASKSGEMFKKLDNDVANANGVMHVVVPTCTEYVINVQRTDLNTDNDNVRYLTFVSGSVGSKKITINDGRQIYYGSSIEIKGFSTGSNDSFMFISQSLKEKSEGKSLEGENETNVITIRVRKYKKRARLYNHHEPFFGSARTRGGFTYKGDIYRSRGGDRDGDRGGDRGRGGDTWGGDYGRDEAFDMEVEEDTKVSLCGTQNSCISGGATVSGGGYVDHVKTTTTYDTFDQEGEDIEFMIQLVCGQSDEEKYEVNRKYQLKKDTEKRDKILDNIERSTKKIKMCEDQITSYQNTIESEKKLIEGYNQELTQFSHLGSTNKTDHLMNFTGGVTSMVVNDYKQ